MKTGVVGWGLGGEKREGLVEGSPVGGPVKKEKTGNLRVSKRGKSGTKTRPRK